MESMTQAQTISAPEAEAARRLRTYRVLFLISILGNLVVGLWCIFAPVSFAHATRLSNSIFDSDRKRIRLVQ
jgi:hypothetical protein